MLTALVCACGRGTSVSIPPDAALYRGISSCELEGKVYGTNPSGKEEYFGSFTLTFSRDKLFEFRYWEKDYECSILGSGIREGASMKKMSSIGGRLVPTTTSFRSLDQAIRVMTGVTGGASSFLGRLLYGQAMNKPVDVSLVSDPSGHVFLMDPGWRVRTDAESHETEAVRNETRISITWKEGGPGLK